MKFYLTNYDIPSVDCSRGGFDLVMVVDGSGSICKNVPTSTGNTCSNWKLVVEFLLMLVDKLPIENGLARQGLVLFNNDVQIKFKLDQ